MGTGTRKLFQSRVKSPPRCWSAACRRAPEMRTSVLVARGQTEPIEVPARCRGSRRHLVHQLDSTRFHSIAIARQQRVWMPTSDHPSNSFRRAQSDLSAAWSVSWCEPTLVPAELGVQTRMTNPAVRSRFEHRQTADEVGGIARTHRRLENAPDPYRHSAIRAAMVGSPAIDSAFRAHLAAPEGLTRPSRSRPPRRAGGSWRTTRERSRSPLLPPGAPPHPPTLGRPPRAWPVSGPAA